LLWGFFTPAHPAWAADPTLDPTFNGSGELRLPALVGRARGLVRQPQDNKLLLVTEYREQREFIVTRVLPDGTLDADFGSGGVVAEDLGYEGESARGLALQTDGKVVVAGLYNRSNPDGLIARYLANGATDRSYGDNGSTVVDLPNQKLRWMAIGMQTNNRAVVGGYAEGDSKDSWVFARFNNAGELDPAFGNGGIATINIFPNSDAISVSEYLQALVVMPDNKIVGAGYIYPGTGTEIALSQLNADGSLDSGFGNQGIVIINPTEKLDEVYTIIRQQDGKLVVAGQVGQSASIGEESVGQAALLRFTAQGALDSTFGVNGFAAVETGGSETFMSVVEMPNHDLVACGTRAVGADPRQYLCARFDPTGQLDTGLGNAGIITGPTSGMISELVLQADNKLVGAGVAMDDTSHILRFQPLPDRPAPPQLELFLPSLP
jgi:uncharacterized delta-60 repeat protein